MNKKKLLMLAGIALCLLASFGCGSGTHKRLFFTPSSYQQMMGFPWTGDPLDIDELVKEYPELKGIVITAPQYIEEVERARAEAKAKGVAVELRPFKIAAGLTLNIEMPGEPGWPRSYTVGPNGFIDVPLIRKIYVIDRTIDEVKEEMEQKFVKYIKSPEVVINVTGTPTYLPGMTGPSAAGQVQGGRIVVMGAGGGATGFGGGFGLGGIQYTGLETLVNTVTPGTNADWRKIRVIRRSETDPLKKSRVIICDLWNYFALADVRQDIPLLPGDVVFVPEKLSLGDKLTQDWGVLLGWLGQGQAVQSLYDYYRGRFDHHYMR